MSSDHFARMRIMGIAVLASLFLEGCGMVTYVSLSEYGGGPRTIPVMMPRTSFVVYTVRCAYPGDGEIGAMCVPMTLLGLEGFVFDVVLCPFDALAVVIDRIRNGFVEEWRWMPEASGDRVRSAVLEITRYKVGGNAPIKVRLEGVRSGTVRVSDPQGKWHSEWTLKGDTTMELILPRDEFEGGGCTSLRVPYDEKMVGNVRGCHGQVKAWPYFDSEAIRFDFSPDFEGRLTVDDVKVYDTDKR